MASLLDAFVKIFADTKDVNAVLQKTIPAQAEQAGKQASSKFSSAFANVKQQVGMGIAQGVGIGITQIGSRAAAAVVDITRSAIDAASNLNEELTKSDQIFRGNATEVEKWAATSADAFGQSERAALSASSNFAGMFKSVGVGINEATDSAKQLTQLGSDLASFFNTDVESALQALRSGLSGEAESLKRYNVFLTEARVKQYAYSEGIADTGKELTEAQKLQARYGLILKDTADAQGDFARTSEGLANRQRTNSAKLENALAKLGQRLLPAVADAAKLASDALDGFSTILDVINGQAPATSDGMVDLAGALLNLIPGVAGFNLGMSQAKQKMEAAQQEADNLAEAQKRITETTAETTARLAEQNKTIDDHRTDLKGFAQAYDTASGVANTFVGQLLDVADAAKRSAAKTNDDRQATEDLKAAIDDLLGSMDDALAAFGDQQYSADELKGKINELTAELRGQINHLHELEAIKHPTRDQRDDIIQTKGKIAETRHEIFDTRVDLAKLDATTMKGLLAELAKVQYQTGVLGDRARAALDIFRKLAFAAKNTPGYNVDPGYAPRTSTSPPKPKPTTTTSSGKGISAPQPLPLRMSTSTLAPSYDLQLDTRAPMQINQSNHVHVEGLVKARDPFEIANAMERFERTGLFTLEPQPR